MNITRGFRETDFNLVVEMIDEGVNIAVQANGLASRKKLEDFMDLVQSSDFPLMGNVMDLKRGGSKLLRLGSRISEEVFFVASSSFCLARTVPVF